MNWLRIFGVKRRNPEQEARAREEAARLSAMLASEDKPKEGVDPLGEKIPADPKDVQHDPGPGIEVKLPVDPNAKQ